MPRLLHVFATFVPGGPQVRTARLIAALGGEWRHAIVAMDGETAARELLPEGVEVELVPGPAASGTIRSVRRLRALIAERRPDLLLTYNWGAIEAVLAGRLAGLRAVLHHEDGFRPDEAFTFKRRRIWARRLVLRGVHGVVVPSRTLRDVATDLWKLPADRVHWIPNGVDVAAFGPADGRPELRAELGIPNDAFLAGFVGHLRAEKNPVRSIETMARLRDARIHLLVLGDGPERGEVEAAVRAHGLGARVHLVGHRPATRDYYRAMDAFLVTSDTEQMPVALLEAMASGLPVVATDVGDVGRILPSSGRELLVSLSCADVPGELARALAGLSSGRERARELGRANRGEVEREYAFERMVERYRGLYSSALQGVPAAAGEPA